MPWGIGVLLYPTFDFMLLKLGVVEIKNESKQCQLAFPCPQSFVCEKPEVKVIGPDHTISKCYGGGVLTRPYVYAVPFHFVIYTLTFKKASSSGANCLSLSLIYSFNKYLLPTLSVSY